MSLAQLGGGYLSPSFLSQVERGRSRISLRALAIVAERLELPISYFFDEHGDADPRLERTDAALAHSLFLHQQGDREGAVLYALRAVAIALREHA
jgi:transcriptional regulator with XRE-family HTH domain